MANKLFVGGLAPNVTSDDLKQLFASHGTVESAVVIINRDTGLSKGFGFVEMNTDNAAAASIQALNNHELQGKQISVNTARPPQNSGGGHRPNRRF